MLVPEVRSMTVVHSCRGETAVRGSLGYAAQYNLVVLGRCGGFGGIRVFALETRKVRRAILFSFAPLVESAVRFVAGDKRKGFPP